MSEQKCSQRAAAAPHSHTGLDHDDLRKAVLGASVSIPETYRIEVHELGGNTNFTGIDANHFKHWPHGPPSP